MKRRNTAFTLVELMATMTSASILVLGMTSTIYIALQASDSSTNPANQTLNGIIALSELEYDLTYAKDIINGTSSNLEIVVADRDGDLTDDLIVYNWRGDAGQPLTRTFNSDESETLINQVESLQFFYTEDESSKLIYVDVQATVGDTRKAVAGSFVVRNRP